eukprot:CAMPEP_0178930828 /NCGR_PEP_ID=MMETSP0786-20121207/21521_1 /TAXON_ID=186022 /ORGANISM="Thalassionema frauenfeldii, Strain CCMP 1798" /LENGTH=146 /DNA_ID=CAMNT_0020607537 /DNA_START=3 /DNA_END=443 /DNA_ORIENTATION=+
MPAALMQMDAMKRVSYVHNTQEASENMAAKQMGGKYFNNKSLPFCRNTNHLKNDGKTSPSPPSMSIITPTSSSNKRKATLALDNLAEVATQEVATKVAAKENIENKVANEEEVAATTTEVLPRRTMLPKIPPPANNHEYTSPVKDL